MRLDVGIAGERIAFVAEPGVVAAEAARTIDATGLLVLPGGVEPHAHIHEPMHRGWSQGREEWLQPPEGATRAALFGGTTTVVSFAFMDVHVRDRELDCNLAVQHRTEVFRGRSYADFAFHPVLTGTLGDTTRDTIGEAIADGTADVQVLHHRPDDDAGRRAARPRVGARTARRVRAARRDGDGARRGRRPHQVHGGPAAPRGAHRAAQRPPRPHARGRGARRAHDRRARPARRAPRSTSRTCAASPRSTPSRRGGRPDSRSTARCCTTPLLLARRLREARRREVPHRHGAAAAAGLRGALGRPRGRPPLHAGDGRVHHQPWR